MSDTPVFLNGILSDVLFENVAGSGLHGATLGTLAANRCGVPSSSIAVAAGHTSRRVHWAHPDGDVSGLQTVDVGYYMGNTVTLSSVYQIKRFIEYPVGQFHQVTWNGETSVEIVPGKSVKSDPVDGLVIPAGSQFWVRTVNLQAASVLPVYTLPAPSDAIGAGDGIAATDLGNTGVVSPTSGVHTFGPTAIIGSVHTPIARAFALLGDHVMGGDGDTSTVGTKGGSGWAARMLDLHGYPYIKVTTGQQSAAGFVDTAAALNELLGEFNWTDLISAYGLYDLKSGFSEDQVLRFHQQIYDLSNMEGKLIWQTTITPITTSTDGWETVEGQTPSMEGSMAELTDLNTYLRETPGRVYAILDVADAAMSERDSNVHSAPPTGTPDGTTFNSERAGLIASLLEPKLAT